MNKQIFVLACIMLCNQVTIGSQQQLDKLLYQTVIVRMPAQVATLLRLKGNPNGQIREGSNVTSPLQKVMEQLPGNYLGGQSEDPILRLLNQEVARRNKAQAGTRGITQQLKGMQI